jgi:hypothetical protein
MEVTMRSLIHFGAGLAVGAFAVMILSKTPTSATMSAMQPQTISVEALMRSIDVSALPVTQVAEPF